ncbi:MAG TPA: hypothetical protein VH419_03845, partial [Nocardioidaceae bacterium]
QTFFSAPPSMPAALSAAVGQQLNGSPLFAFGTSDGSVKLWDPAVTSSTLLSQIAGSTSAAVDALTFTERVDGTVGISDLVAVSSRGNSAHVLRFSGATTLEPRPVAPNGVTSTDVGGIRAWFPGYKSGVLSVINRTDSPVEVDFAFRDNVAFGCFLTQQIGGAPALPADPVTVAPARGADYLLGFLTAGEGGDCASTDFTGQWAIYMTVAPVDDPADRTVAKLVWSRSGQLSVQSVGGSPTLQTEALDLGVERPLGGWEVSTLSPPAPGVPSNINVTGNRLDPAGGTDPPVYRFDVGATAWPLPFSTPPRIQTVLPPMEVRGITSTNADVPLGWLVPEGQPTRATSGTVTLSPESFYWQNPTVGQQITDIYVQVGSTSSSRVNLAGLPAPDPGTPIGSVQACPTSGAGDCTATAAPFATGLDQAKLRVQLFDANSQELPITDPAYSHLYYRDEDGDLITGLIPEDGSSYIRVSPCAGAYPNDGSTTSTIRPPTSCSVGGRFDYLSTTSTDDQQVTAHVGGFFGTVQPAVVEAVAFSPQVQAGSDASQGFYVTPCVDNRGTDACRIAKVGTTTPGLFLTNDPDTQALLIGLQLRSTAQSSLLSLPLEQVSGQPEHIVAEADVNINNSEISLNTSSGFQPADTVDTWVVSHGAQVPITQIRVGGGN